MRAFLTLSFSFRSVKTCSVATKSQTSQVFCRHFCAIANRITFICLQTYLTENVYLEQYSAGAYSNHRTSLQPLKDAAFLHPSLRMEIYPMCQQSNLNITHFPQNKNYLVTKIHAFYLSFFVIKETFFDYICNGYCNPFTGESRGNGLINYEPSVFIFKPSLNVAVKNGNYQYKYKLRFSKFLVPRVIPHLVDFTVRHSLNLAHCPSM